MEDDEVERGADYFRIETFRPCGDADIQECVVIFGNAVLENGMGGVQLLQETDESFTGGACRRDTQMDAEQGMNALPAGMAATKATESFSSWESLRVKKFRTLSFMYFSKMPAFTFLPGLKLITFAMAPPVRDFIFHSLYYGCS